MPKFLLDTNMLMDDKAKEGYVPYPVLEELDKLKTAEGIRGKQAREAIHRLYKNPEKFPFLYEELKLGERVDDFLIRIAGEHGLTLRTLDLSLHLKGEALGISTKYSHNGVDSYTGATHLTNEEWCALNEGALNTLYPNNHFLIYDKNAYVIRNGSAERIDYKSLNSTYSGKIKPRNVEQYCLMELLDSDIPVICATGKPGSGKSYLMLNYALTQLETGHIDKLVFAPANAYVKDSFDIAALPGDLLSKQEHMLGPLVDLVGIAKVRYLVDNEQIELLPIATARGRSFTKSILYLSEAQNLSEDHMQLLVSRLAEESRMFVDGDYQGQIDKKVFENKNGIRLLLNLAKTNEAHLFGTVRLEKIERSEVAQLAEVMAQFR